VVRDRRSTSREKITVTKHGIPAARLVPVDASQPKPSHQEIVDGMRTLRKRVKTDKMSVREMISVGR
jgi:antitoxin (DNA-binding transcriptional repressor) of toxin-antitoxin stability system